MAERVFFLYRLKEGVDPAEFERFAREVEEPLAARLPSIRRYALTRISGALGGGEAPYDYVEALEVTDLAEYERDGADPEVAAFLGRWSEYVAEYVAVVGETVAEI